LIINTHGNNHKDGGAQYAWRGPQERLGQVHEGPDQEQDHMDKGEEGIEQLHHDSTSV